MKVDVKFDFYEQRPYIHSTQLVYELLKIMKNNNYYNRDSEIIKIYCIYKSLCNKQGYYIIDEDYHGEFSTYFKIKLESVDINAYYIETEEKVINRIAYDEDNIILNHKIDELNKCAFVEVYRNDNLYNIIIALLKKLLNNLFVSDGYTSWKVGKFIVDWSKLHHNAVGKNLKICVHNSLDDMYVQSKIFLDDCLVGSIENAREKK